MVILGIALLSTIAPLTLFLAGLQKMSSSKASILVMVEPVVANLNGVLIFGETMSAIQVAGAVLILISMLLQAMERGSATEFPRPSESLS
jgi:drug/metabolite transporter (DMT)-like permease